MLFSRQISEIHQETNIEIGPQFMHNKSITIDGETLHGALYLFLPTLDKERL